MARQAVGEGVRASPGSSRAKAKARAPWVDSKVHRIRKNREQLLRQHADGERHVVVVEVEAGEARRARVPYAKKAL